MKLILSFLTVLIFFIFSCKKEVSLENSLKETSSGSLQADGTGDCLPKTLEGSYIANKALASTNFIEVDVDVATEGSYSISTDTVNGYYFKGSGNFSNTGINTIKLAGQGKPLAEGTDVFTVSFDSTICSIEVTVLPATAGGPASFTLQTSGSNCNATPAGNFVKGTALNSTNKLNLEVNVTTIGSYSISTTATNGITFSGSGAFTTTGAQTISLTGSGTPVNEGATSIPITAGSTTCNVSVDVTAAGTQPPPPTGAFIWKFTAGGKVHQGAIDADAQLLTNQVGGFTFTTLTFKGSASTTDTSIIVAINDISGGINNNETYSSTALTTNNGGLVVNYGGDVYQADPQTTGASISFKVTTHNTSTKVIAGTFSGTVKGSSSTLAITAGTFNVKYQ